jgi:hypothetical protein
MDLHEEERPRPELLLAVPFRKAEGGALGAMIGPDGRAEVEAVLSPEVAAGRIYGLRGRVGTGGSDFVVLVETVSAAGGFDFLWRACRLEQAEKTSVRQERFTVGQAVRAKVTIYGKPSTVVQFDLAALVG